MSYDCVMISPSSCSAWRPVWMCQIWTDDSHQLRICLVTESISLTVKNSTHIDAQHSIQLYREKSREPMHLQGWVYIEHNFKEIFSFFLSIVELSKECGNPMVIVTKGRTGTGQQTQHRWSNYYFYVAVIHSSQKKITTKMSLNSLVSNFVFHC